MNPLPKILAGTGAIGLLALVLTGCGRRETDRHAHDPGAAEHGHEAEGGVTYNAKKGLLVPPATAKYIGLKIADVEERKLAATLQFSAQVYRAANEARFASLQADITPTALISGNISPGDADKLNASQTVFVRSANDGAALPGRIVTLKRDLEKASGQVEVLLAVADAQQPLAAGAFVVVTVVLGNDKMVVGVPRGALLRTTEGDFVYTVSGDHFMRSQVNLGSVNSEFAEIADGLYAGDQIVVYPVMALWMAELQSLRGGKSCADGH